MSIHIINYLFIYLLRFDRTCLSLATVQREPIRICLKKKDFFFFLLTMTPKNSFKFQKKRGANILVIKTAVINLKWGICVTK